MIVFDLYPEGKKKALTMSYDDGHTADRRLLEIFNKYGIRGTFHLNAHNYTKENPSFSPSELTELYKGHEISAHTYSHPFPNSLPREALIQEILKDREVLEKASGYPVRGMSYPFGQYNKDVIALFKSLGMEYSRTCKSTNGFGIPEDFMEWHPTCHHKHDLLAKLEAFKNPSNGRVPHLMLFYVWGHSFEFDNNNNWDLIESFCKEASGLDDVWYATNIEIVDYITALRSLRFGINQDVVYNPSALTCWFTSDGKEIKVAPGETVRF